MNNNTLPIVSMEYIDKDTPDAIESIIDYFSAEDENFVLLIIPEDTKRTIFSYSIESIIFTFDLLCEVGEIILPFYQELINKHNLIIDTFDTDSQYYNTLRNEID